MTRATQHAAWESGPPHTRSKNMCATTSPTNIFQKAAWWDLSGPCMCHKDWDVTGLFTPRRGWGPTRPAALQHLSRSTPVCLSCYSFPSAADNKLSWSSSAALLLHSQPFPGLILERKKQKKSLLSENKCRWPYCHSCWIELMCIFEGLLAGVSSRSWTALDSRHRNHNATLAVQECSRQPVSNSRSSALSE